jgi:tripartite motif-containing protein 71
VVLLSKTAVTVQSGYDAIIGSNHVASYDVVDRLKAGMAVNSDESMMVMSYEHLHQVHVFRLTPSFERMRVIGRYGTGPAEFHRTRQLCFTDDNTILVCDSYNNRVQQLTVTGEYLSSFAAQSPFTIAVHGDMVAVGTDYGPIKIHSVATGELNHRFGSRGDGPGQIGEYATGIRFTPDGSRLLVAECNNMRLSLFTVDGVFVKHIGAGALAMYGKDVSFGAGGEIVVAESRNHRICVFSPDGDTLIKTWGSEGNAASQFEYPQALAVSGSHLYVMDDKRVQVFE